MRRTLAFVLAALIAVAVGFADDEKVTTEPATSPPTTSEPTEPLPTSGAPSPTPPPPASAAVDGETLAVTVVKVVDPARAENQYSSPDAGKRFVAVQFRLKNTGTAVCSEAPSNGA